MAAQAQQSIHLVEIPTDRLPLLVPSATIAEIINVGELSPLPLAPPWVLGVTGWRTKAVVVVSFEALLAGTITTPGPPIIIITSRAGDKHRQRAFELGVDLYMSKPYHEDDLFKNIDELLVRETVH